MRFCSASFRIAEKKYFPQLFFKTNYMHYRITLWFDVAGNLEPNMDFQIV